MFNILYRCPRTVARHENGPLHESRRRYLEHVAAQGAALHTLRGAAGIIYRAAIWMKLDESSPVERKEVERAAKRWADRSYRNASCRGPQQTDREFRQTTCNWLRFAGRLREVLVDQQVVRSGRAATEPWKFYDLGHGHCTYDFFDQCPHRMACAKCSFYMPKGSSQVQLLQGKANLLQLRQEIPLNDSELAAVDDGVAAMEKLLEQLVDVPHAGGTDSA